MAASNEIALVEACKRNDPKAQAALYTLYKGRLLGVCRRYARTEAEAEDIFQEAFIKIFTNLHQLRRPEAVSAWVKSMVIHTAIDYYRAALRERQQEDVQPLDEQLPDDSPDLLVKLHVDDILRIINQLPNGYRLVLNLYLIDGYPHAEVAALLGISESTSKSQLSRAKDLLRKQLVKLGLVSYGNE